MFTAHSVPWTLSELQGLKLVLCVVCTMIDRAHKPISLCLGVLSKNENLV